MGGDDLVIIGSGIAGHSAAAELARRAPDRRIHVIGTEEGAPYDRPPLSKDYLLADEAIIPHLPSGAIYGGPAMLRDGVTATSIMRDAQQVVLSDGAILPYGALLLATGSRLRRLPLPKVDPARIHYLRTLDDARRLRAALAGAPRVCIVGGGFIGLEVAAAARSRGARVTLLELAPQLLSRGASPALSSYVHAAHVERGVTTHLDALVEEAFEDRDGATVRWAEGDATFDIIVIGVGIVPNLELARDAGLAVGDGIMIDGQCRTSDPAIFAAGEVTNYPIEKLGLSLRTESWSVAGSQASVAAQNMLGGSAAFNELPWFWSDQYNLNIQCLGIPRSASRVLLVGDPAGEKWLRIGLDAAGQLVGAEAVNMGREISALRRADRTGQPIPQWLLDLADIHEDHAIVGAGAETPCMKSS